MKTFKIALYCLVSLLILVVGRPAAAIVYVSPGHPIKREALERYWHLQTVVKYEPLFDWQFAPPTEQDPDMIMDVTNEGNHVYLKDMTAFSESEALKVGVKTHFTKGCQSRTLPVAKSGIRSADGACGGRRYLMQTKRLDNGIIILGVASWPKGSEGVAAELEELMEGAEAMPEEEKETILSGERTFRFDSLYLEYPEEKIGFDENGGVVALPGFTDWGEGLEGNRPWRVQLGHFGDCGAIRINVFGKDATPKGAVVDYWLKDIEDKNDAIKDTVVRHDRANGTSQGLVSYGEVTEFALAGVLNEAGTVMIEAAWHEQCSSEVRNALRFIVGTMHAADDTRDEPDRLKKKESGWLF